MSKKQYNKQSADSEKDLQTNEQETANGATQTEGREVNDTPAQETEEPSLEQQVETLRTQVQELEDKNLRMMAEFDNYRRRTNKEKLELIETAGERIFKDMLPLVDDFERALAAMEQTEGASSHTDGVQLIYKKFITFLEQNHVIPIETEGKEFSTDEHEAITTFAAGEDKKGKIIDCTQRGYKLGDKVIRFAKVVVGE